MGTDWSQAPDAMQTEKAQGELGAVIPSPFLPA